MPRGADYDNGIPQSDNAIEAGETKAHGTNPVSLPNPFMNQTPEAQGNPPPPLLLTLFFRAPTSIDPTRPAPCPK